MFLSPKRTADPVSDHDPAAVSLGRKGGLARSKALTRKRKLEIARLAGIASGKARRRKSK